MEKTLWLRLLGFLKYVVAVESRVNGGWKQCSMEQKRSVRDANASYASIPKTPN
jgi:hypothetical protein